MDQEELQFLASGREPDPTPPPVAADPDFPACEDSSPGTRSAAPDPGAQEAGSGPSSSPPRPGLSAGRARARGRKEISEGRILGRIVEVRRELYGDEGVPAIADELQLPPRTWMNYEAGVVMPAIVLLCFVDLTRVEPHWLLTGRGPKFQGPRGGFASPTRDERALRS